MEVKRSTDTRIRREVVGQMLDYSANAVVYWPVDRIRSRFEANCERQGSEPDERLRDFLDSEVEPEEFWQKANTNLQAGRVRLLFIADEIPPKLQRIVEFLNVQMNPAEVLAVEIKQFVGQGRTGLVPRVIGQTAEAQQKKSAGIRSTMNEDEFLEALSPEEAIVATKILDWSRDNFSRIDWKGASFVPVLEYRSTFSHNPITVYTGSKVPRVGIKFGRMKNRNRLTEEKRIDLLRRLNEIPGVNLPQDSIGRFPSIPLSTLANGNALEQFLKAVAWTIEEVKAARQDPPADLLSQSTRL